MSRTFLVPVRISPLASNPASGTEGDIYYNTADDTLRYYTGSVWVSILTTTAAASAYQPLDGDLTAIAALSGTSGLLRKTAANTWTLDTTDYSSAGVQIHPFVTAII